MMMIFNDRQVSMARLYHSTRATEQSHTSHFHTANHTVKILNSYSILLDTDI